MISSWDQQSYGKLVFSSIVKEYKTVSILLNITGIKFSSPGSMDQ